MPRVRSNYNGVCLSFMVQKFIEMRITSRKFSLYVKKPQNIEKYWWLEMVTPVEHVFCMKSSINFTDLLKLKF